MTKTNYSAAGVNIAAANYAKELMTTAVRATHGPAVLAGIGAFGGCFDADIALAGITAPVLVASTDGVGTKVLVAAAMNRYDTIGQDLVNHCVNDILVQGAQPLFFLDYIAAAKLDPELIATVVGGVAQACQTVGCALLGGETAEMPGVYELNAFDLAGTIVGSVSRVEMLPRTDITAGDIILALPSNGLHTNGYSLARRIVEQLPNKYATQSDELDGQSIGDALLAIHRCYLHDVRTLRAVAPIKALAHITGGGIFDNLPRILPDTLGAVIERGTWPIPSIFTLLQRLGNLPDQEAYHVFNMGLGMLVIIPPEAVAAAQAVLPEARCVGRVTSHPGVSLIGIASSD